MATTNLYRKLDARWTTATQLEATWDFQNKLSLTAAGDSLVLTCNFLKGIESVNTGYSFDGSSGTRTVSDEIGYSYDGITWEPYISSSDFGDLIFDTANPLYLRFRWTRGGSAPDGEITFNSWSITCVGERETASLVTWGMIEPENLYASCKSLFKSLSEDLTFNFPDTVVTTKPLYKFQWAPGGQCPEQTGKPYIYFHNTGARISPNASCLDQTEIAVLVGIRRDDEHVKKWEEMKGRITTRLGMRACDYSYDILKTGSEDAPVTWYGCNFADMGFERFQTGTGFDVMQGNDKAKGCVVTWWETQVNLFHIIQVIKQVA